MNIPDKILNDTYRNEIVEILLAYDDLEVLGKGFFSCAWYSQKYNVVVSAAPVTDVYKIVSASNRLPHMPELTTLFVGDRVALYEMPLYRVTRNENALSQDEAMLYAALQSCDCLKLDVLVETIDNLSRVLPVTVINTLKTLNEMLPQDPFEGFTPWLDPKLENIGFDQTGDIVLLDIVAAVL